MGARGALRGLLASILLAATASAVAASFALAPLGLSIAPGEVSGSVVVTNSGTDELVVQARPYAWTQAGTEARVDTRDLVLNPPMFKLAPGEQQLVRVAPRAAPLTDAERAYRLVFSEVPLQLPTGTGFRITVAMDIPVFIEPARPGTANVKWRIGAGGTVVADNAGGRHLRLRDVQILQGTTAVHTIPRLVVLARSRLDIPLPDAAKAARALRLTGQDDADQTVTIDIAPPDAQ